MSSHVAVLGAGSWGTTLANLLARKGLDVRLWGYEQEVVESINTRGVNDIFLADSPLDTGLRATGSLQDAIAGATMVCCVIPSHVARRVLTSAAPHVSDGVPLVCATKGIEPETLALMSDVGADVLPMSPFVALSGPSFAQEVYAGQPTAVVAASTDALAVEQVQQAFSTSSFRVYSGSDVVGVELGGSLKNTMAIASGVLEGLGLGNNPRAALITRGLAEITRLGSALGADPHTFAGLAGMGDLILTCTGALSRNRQLGVALAQGTTLEEYTATHRTVAEGVNTARAASRLADRHGVEMPITRQVAAVLFEGASPRECIQVLMERTLKAERWG
ncbi:MAG: NAD(P)H-dependent glycerol-3-phosphate dehydrogenase [Aeromicrobium sp.]